MTGGVSIRFPSQIAPFEIFKGGRSRLDAETLGKRTPSLALVPTVLTHHNIDRPMGLLSQPETDGGITRRIDGTENEIELRTGGAEMGPDTGTEPSDIPRSTDIETVQISVEFSVCHSRHKQDKEKRQ